jgi:Glycosyl transferases group 1
MRLTIVGRAERDSLASCLARGCSKAAMDVTLVPAPPPLVRFRRLKYLRRAGLDWLWLFPHLRQLAREIAATRPQGIVMVKALGLRPVLVRRLREHVNAPLWNLYPDIPYDPADAPFRVVEMLAAFDGVLIWSNALAERLRRDGIERVEVLKFACDDDLYFPPPDPVDREIDISFVGTWHPSREEVVRAIGPVRAGLVAGPGWNRAGALPAGWRSSTERVAPEEARRVYWRSKVVLNPLHPLSLPGYNMRSLEVPASGAVMLTTRTPDHEELFNDCREAVLYDDPPDAARRFTALMEQASLLETIRTNAVRRTRRETYETRAREVVEHLG